MDRSQSHVQVPREPVCTRGLQQPLGAAEQWTFGCWWGCFWPPLHLFYVLILSFSEFAYVTGDCRAQMQQPYICCGITLYRVGRKVCFEFSQKIVWKNLNEPFGHLNKYLSSRLVCQTSSPVARWGEWGTPPWAQNWRSTKINKLKSGQDIPLNSVKFKKIKEQSFSRWTKNQSQINTGCVWVAGEVIEKSCHSAAADPKPNAFLKFWNKKKCPF